MDSGGANVGSEKDGDEAKWMGETWAPMALTLYVGDPLM